MATWTNIGDGGRKQGYRTGPDRSILVHVGSQMGAKLEPKVVKMAIKNASKIEVDFEMIF